ncbi:MAG: hypothetical protein WCQ41_07140 [Bacillota bacterium]
MAEKQEKKFLLSHIFDPNNEYALWIISFATARQDLYHVNKSLIKINSLKEDANQEPSIDEKISAQY